MTMVIYKRRIFSACTKCVGLWFFAIIITVVNIDMYLSDERLQSPWSQENLFMEPELNNNQIMKSIGNQTIINKTLMHDKDSKMNSTADEKVG